MNFQEMQKEIQAIRFTGQELTRIARWINNRYSAIWNAADWNFKRAKPTPIYFTDSSEASLPEDFGSAYSVLDCNNNKLRWLEPEDYAMQSNGGGGVFTVVDRRLYTPSPPDNGWLLCSYERRLSHFDSDGTLHVGPMNQDLDTPVIPEEHHYLLVLDATILGLMMENDPTWQDLAPARDEMMQVMREELTPSHQYARLQYGTDVR